MNTVFAARVLPQTPAVVVGVFADRNLGETGAALDAAAGGSLVRAMEAGAFSGKAEETLTVLAPAGLTARRVVLLGLGKPGDLTAAGGQKAGGAIIAALEKAGDAEAAVIIDDVDGAALTSTALAAEAAFGAALRSYRFDKYRTKEKPEAKPALQTLTFLCAEPTAAESAFAALAPVAAAVTFARDTVSEPANVIYPETLAERCKGLESPGLKVEVLEPEELRAKGMGALLGVAQGSANSARVVVMRYDGAPDDKDRGPVAFIGKGVTFDSGGISIKSAGGMEDMKWDMAGSAAVIGTMHALAGRKAKVNAVGVVGLVENMPSATAQRPGDVVTSMSGQTIEVINTDAEGRLVLCDCMHYAQEAFKPRLMVDVATLTGAIIVSLGREYAGLFCNNDTLAGDLTAAGAAVGEPLWRLPLGEAYDKDINSDIADMKNIGTPGVGGSITAAQFLKRFVTEDRAWAHLDIAGVAWAKKDSPTTPKGATAFGVRLLDRFVADFCEA
jgi:leucyl aminopeptidase